MFVTTHIISIDISTVFCFIEKHEIFTLESLTIITIDFKIFIETYAGYSEVIEYKFLQGCVSFGRNK